MTSGRRASCQGALQSGPAIPEKRHAPDLLAACLWSSAFVAAAAERASAPTREHMAPDGWEDSYHGLHYTPVLKIGDRVIVSGIPALEGADDEAKIRWMFKQLELHLATAGATLADVVEITSYHVATDHAQFRRRIEPMLRVHREVFRDHYPAWTAVDTTALFSDNAPVEMGVEAIIGSGRHPKADIPQPAVSPQPKP